MPSNHKGEKFKINSLLELKKSIVPKTLFLCGHDIDLVDAKVFQEGKFKELFPHAKTAWKSIFPMNIHFSTKLRFNDYSLSWLFQAWEGDPRSGVAVTGCIICQMPARAASENGPRSRRARGPINKKEIKSDVRVCAKAADEEVPLRVRAANLVLITIIS